MTLLHRLRSIVLWIGRRESAEQDLNDELQAFVDMAAADKTRAGAIPAEARRLAVLELGGLELVKEQVEAAVMAAGSTSLGGTSATDCGRSDAIRRSLA